MIFSARSAGRVGVGVKLIVRRVKSSTHPHGEGLRFASGDSGSRVRGALWWRGLYQGKAWHLNLGPLAVLDFRPAHYQHAITHEYRSTGYELAPAVPLLSVGERRIRRTWWLQVAVPCHRCTEADSSD